MEPWTAMTDTGRTVERSRLPIADYGWLLLPLLFAFLAFPLARVALAGSAFLWVALLLFQRRRRILYVRAVLMVSVALVAWLMLCALLTFLADDAFRWAGETFANGGAMVTTTLMFTFTIFASTAAVVTMLLRIGGWGEAAILFACLMCMASGAVLSGMVDSLWAFPICALAASGLLALFLAWKPLRALIRQPR